LKLMYVGKEIDLQPIFVSLDKGEKNKEVKFQIDHSESGYDFYPYFYYDNENYGGEIKWIDYQHIPLNYYLRSAQTKIVNFDNSKLTKRKIGYIMGAGDEIPQVLENV